MKFTKMQGGGNDYIYVNCFTETVADPSAAAIRLSDRHFGVGGDGLVLICPSNVADFCMEMYNADGSRSEMCGNAIRCVGKYVYDRGLTDKTELTIETRAGIKTLWLNVVGGTVEDRARVQGQPGVPAGEDPGRGGGGDLPRAADRRAGRDMDRLVGQYRQPALRHLRGRCHGAGLPAHRPRV